MNGDLKPRFSHCQKISPRSFPRYSTIAKTYKLPVLFGARAVGSIGASHVSSCDALEKHERNDGGSEKMHDRIVLAKKCD